MREQIKQALALLVTDDAAVESALRQEAKRLGVEVEVQHSTQAALATLMDGCGNEDFAVVDLETRRGRRRVLTTAGGRVPVLAITSRPASWLSSMERRHRIGATLPKPFTAPQLQEALQRLRERKPRTARAV